MTSLVAAQGLEMGGKALDRAHRLAIIHLHVERRPPDRILELRPPHRRPARSTFSGQVQARRPTRGLGRRG